MLVMLDMFYAYLIPQVVVVKCFDFVYKVQT